MTDAQRASYRDTFQVFEKSLPNGSMNLFGERESNGMYIIPSEFMTREFRDWLKKNKESFKNQKKPTSRKRK